MEASECIRTRRTIRKYFDKPVPQIIVDKLIESARFAPSSDNSQPWEFIVITNKNIKKRLANLHPWANHIENAPVVIAILGNLNKCKDDFLNTINTSLAMQNLMLEAHNQGLGSSCIEIIDTEFEKEETAKKILKIPENLLIHCIITIGYPDEELKLKKVNDAIVHYDYYLS